MPLDDDIAPIFLWLYFLYSYKVTFWLMHDIKLKVDIMKNPHNHSSYFKTGNVDGLITIQVKGVTIGKQSSCTKSFEWACNILYLHFNP